MFLAIYIARKNRILLGYKVQNFRNTQGPLNISIYLLFAEIFMQFTTDNRYGKFMWGGFR